MKSHQYLNFFLSIFILLIIRPAHFLPIEPPQSNNLTAQILDTKKSDNSDLLVVEKRLTVAEPNNSINASQPEKLSDIKSQADVLSVNETKTEASLNTTTKETADKAPLNETTTANKTITGGEAPLNENVTTVSVDGTTTTTTTLAGDKASLNGTTPTTTVDGDKTSLNGTTTTSAGDKASLNGTTTTSAGDKASLNGTTTASAGDKAPLNGTTSTSSTKTESETTATTVQETTDDFLPADPDAETNLKPSPVEQQNQEDQDENDNYQKPNAADDEVKPDWSGKELIKPQVDEPVENKIDEVPPVNKNIQPYYDEEDEESSFGFLTYFFIFSSLCIVVYVAYINKNKILALILEGKRQTNQRRFNSNVYNRLENVHDVMPNLN